MILAGDIGGTKSNLALFAVKGEVLTPHQAGVRFIPIVEQTFSSREYASLEDVIREFLSGQAVKKSLSGGENRDAGNHIGAACFGVAGPVVEDRCETPNLPWIISTSELKRALGLEIVELINDLEATGYGIPALRGEELIMLNQAVPRQGHAALIAAGTGLGEALLYWDGDSFRPTASEGGHADFAPRNVVEIELLRYLLDRFPHVSYERVLSGPGLFNIYKFLRDSGYGEEPPWLAEKLGEAESSMQVVTTGAADPGAIISEAALARQSELCVKALDLFVSVYGAEAGNLALKFVAVGGVYVGGGIAPKILGKLQDGTFMKAFTDKGRLSPLVTSVPVWVILNPKTALYGAARRAALLKK